MTPERERCLHALADLILAVDRPHPVRVAVDGPDAAGKTNLFGDKEAVRRRYAARYVPGQRLYFATAEPQAKANVVFDNADPDRPILRSRAPAV